jgi:hypothetical protein
MEEVQLLRQQAEHWRRVARKFAISNVMLFPHLRSMALKPETLRELSATPVGALGPSDGSLSFKLLKICLQPHEGVAIGDARD